MFLELSRRHGTAIMSLAREGVNRPATPLHKRPQPVPSLGYRPKVALHDPTEEVGRVSRLRPISTGPKGCFGAVPSCALQCS